MGTYTICPTCSRINLHAGGCKSKCYAAAVMAAGVSSVALGIVLNGLRDSLFN